MPAPPKFAPGTVLGGRYELVAPIGKGAMGEVWRAEHRGLRTSVAVKVIDPKLLDDAKGEDRRELLGRFEREAQAAAALTSAHVVRVLDHGLEDDVPYIAMELLAGETLAERLERVGRLSEGQTLLVLSHVARAITRAHELGIIHRDLKPENVFLARAEGETIAKVLDFGVAKILRSPLKISPKTTRSGAMLGTPCYMSPEQVQGVEPVQAASDVWSLAIIAFECLTGCLPWSSESVGDLVLSICVRPIPPPSSCAPLSAHVDAWFARATDRDPARRYPTPSALVEGLREALERSGVPLPASIDEPPPSASVALATAAPAQTGKVTDGGVSTAVWRRSPPRRRPWLFAAGAGAALLALTLGVFFALRDPSGTRPAPDEPRGAASSTADSASAPPLASAASAAPSATDASLTSAQPSSAGDPADATAVASSAASSEPSARPWRPARRTPRPTADPRLGL